MKKTLLTTLIALCTLVTSAQISVMTTISQPAEGQEWSSESLTENLAIGYQLNEKIMVGVKSAGDDYNMYGRYNVTSDIYISVESSTEMALDSLDYGIGYSIKVMDKLYLEPSYMIKKEEGKFMLGVAYKL
jgi:hypothetical protein|tara:strand:- start:1643 stop:2035 length:393 start_codon:yes stop_codon:yes gene_type:complete